MKMYLPVIKLSIGYKPILIETDNLLGSALSSLGIWLSFELITIRNIVIKKSGNRFSAFSLPLYVINF